MAQPEFGLYAGENSGRTMNGKGRDALGVASFFLLNKEIWFTERADLESRAKLYPLQYKYKS